MKKLTIFAFLLLSLISVAQERYGVVEFSTAMMREKPSYTAELGNQLLMGEVVRIIDSDRYWLKVVSPDPYTAWTTNMGIVEMSEEQIQTYIKADKFIVVTELSHVYKDPSMNSLRITDLVAGDLLLAGEGRCKGFFAVVLPSGKKGWVKASDIMQFRKWAEKSECNAQNLLSFAYNIIGVPYLWGGNTTKGLDCSGLVSMAFFMNGVLLPRNASQQARIGEAVDFEGVERGDFSALQSGDLIFFGSDAEKISHVAFYIGEGKIIHSSHLVRINSLVDGEEDNYSRQIVAVRRLINVDNQENRPMSILSSPYYFPQGE